jgi:hypothetical protein
VTELWPKQNVQKRSEESPNLGRALQQYTAKQPPVISGAHSPNRNIHLGMPWISTGLKRPSHHWVLAWIRNDKPLPLAPYVMTETRPANSTLAQRLTSTIYTLIFCLIAEAVLATMEAVVKGLDRANNSRGQA